MSFWLRSSSRRLKGVGAALSLALFAAAVMARPPLPPVKAKVKKVEFNRDIRPILDKCLSCHGHDPKAIQAGLRLDNRVGAIKILADGRAAIVSGHPEKSELIARVNSKDKYSLMPPPDSNRVLSVEDKAVLAEWIRQGAEYKPHWAFVKPVRPPLPKVADKAWPSNAIDSFILARLEDEGLSPSPDADRRTLIRRVSLDLTGLPPTPEDVDNYLRDHSANAYEKVVDRLLASPEYGERMAMDWMDAARYADSNGYQSDWERFQYRWRDWVINAFNQNMSYDEFTVEQLAGDLLPHPTMDQIIATGFNRNHRINTEGGVIPEEWRIETVIDRVETTSQVWMGLTSGCARCHDHKYDPISQKEFYSLCSYFNNVPETGSGVEQPVNHPPLIEAPYPEETAAREKLTKQIADTKAQMWPRLVANKAQAQSWQLSATTDPALNQGLEARFALVAKPSVPITVSGPVTYEAGRSTGSIEVGDKGYADLGNAGDFDGKHPFSYGAWVYPVGENGSPIAKMDTSHDYRGWDIFLDGLRPAAHLIDKWPDSALKVLSKSTLVKGEWNHIFVTYDGSGKTSGLHMYLNGKMTVTESQNDNLKGPINTTAHLRVGRRTEANIFSGRVDDVALYNRELPAAQVAELAAVSPATPLLNVPVADRTDTQKQELTQFWSFANDPPYRALETARIAAQSSLDLLNAKITSVMVMQEMPKPRDCYVLIRGQYDHHGPQVTAGVPAFLPSIPKGYPNNRLGLAEWIVSPENPLTARVTVNRMWERLFGTGIVATSEDFGTRSEFPSHPELLDWMATELVRLHWNMKAMWKELVMSRTYRQSSDFSAKLVKLDPNNRLLARGPRFRLSAEVLRDQALSAGGLLKEKIGGPSVRPYQPDGVWDDVSVYGNLHNYKHDADPDLHRRSLYTIWKRTAAPPDMTLFDAPSRETCVVRRARTDTPLQALVLLNDETYVEAARGLALRMIEAGGKSVKDRIDFAFQTVLGRDPQPNELHILAGEVARHERHYETEPKDAKKLLSIGMLKNDSKLDPAEVAAYTLTASTILNLDETLTKE
jgi:hypothetical protein